jgi:hypothetical protein
MAAMGLVAAGMPLGGDGARPGGEATGGSGAGGAVMFGGSTAAASSGAIAMVPREVVAAPAPAAWLSGRSTLGDGHTRLQQRGQRQPLEQDEGLEAERISGFDIDA